MTQSIDLDALAIDTTRRDRWGRYLVVPPGGTKPEGYTRVTTVAKALDSGGGLAPWKATMAATGMLMRKGLRAQWETLMAQYQGDPWYHSKDSKEACKRLVEECAAAGGANDRREVGSAFHALTAMADKGVLPEHLTDETRRDLDAYLKGMALVGAEVDPTLMELTVVLDDWKVAGTFDRLVTLPGFPLPVVADIKTGADLTYSYQSIAVQMAAYANADAIYIQGPDQDGSTDQRIPMPEVDKRHGLIIWLNAGTGQLELIVVDLVSGWAAFEISMLVRQWRTRQDLVLPLAEFNYDLPAAEPITEEAVEEAHDTLVDQLEASLAAVGIEVAEREEAPAHDPVPAIRVWLQERIDAIGQHTEARSMLASHWPDGIPTLRASQAHESYQLDIIEALLDGVERAFELPFPAPKPH